MVARVRKTVTIPEYCQPVNFASPENGFWAEYSSGDPTEPFLYDTCKVPKKAYMGGDDDCIADFIAIDGRLAVCREAKQFIEEFEPTSIQFVPITIRRTAGNRQILRLDGLPLTDPYYLFNPQKRLDAVLIEKSDAITRVIPDGRVLVFQDIIQPERKLVFSKAVIGGHHVWMGGLHCPQELFFSDELAAKIVESGLMKFDFTHFAESG